MNEQMARKLINSLLVYVYLGVTNGIVIFHLLKLLFDVKKQ